MRVAAGLLVVVFLGAALALLMTPQTPSAVADAPAASSQVSSTAVEDGRLLYVQNCASCHGAMGQGSAVAPPITSAGPAGLDFYMQTGRMPLGRVGTPDYEGAPTLSQAQIEAIIGYASAFSQGPAIPSVTTGADLSAGWSLYVNNCAACHGAAAEGGSVGAGISAPSLHGVDPVTIAEAMLVGPGPMPVFNFDQQSVNEIASYVESLNQPVAPGPFPISGGPVIEGLVAAVLGLGALVAIVRWVARRDKLPQEPAERQDAHGEDSRPA